MFLPDVFSHLVDDSSDIPFFRRYIVEVATLTSDVIEGTFIGAVLKLLAVAPDRVGCMYQWCKVQDGFQFVSDV